MSDPIIVPAEDRVTAENLRDAAGLFEEVAQLPRRAFLALLAERYSVTEACKAAGLTRACYYNWRRKCPVFRAASERARRIGAGGLIDEAHRRAVVGVRSVKTHKGQLIMVQALDDDDQIIYEPDPETGELKEKMVPLVERKKSDQLLVKLLEANFPEFRSSWKPPTNVEENAIVRAGFTNQQMRERVEQKLAAIVERVTEGVIERLRQKAELEALPAPEPTSEPDDGGE